MYDKEKIVAAVAAGIRRILDEMNDDDASPDGDEFTLILDLDDRTFTIEVEVPSGDYVYVDANPRYDNGMWAGARILDMRDPDHTQEMFREGDYLEEYLGETAATLIAD